MPYAERVRRDAGVKTMAVGLILEPAQADAILEAGQADLIAIGREALYDPSWALHAEGRARGCKGNSSPGRCRRAGGSSGAVARMARSA